MAPVVDMSDKNAWDDSLLIDSWDSAVNEYKKYHSIHQSGKKLEDVLTEEELKELRADYGDLMDGAETASAAAETNGVADHEDIDTPMSETNSVAQADQSGPSPQQEPDLSGEQEPQIQLPRAEAPPVPHAAGSLAGAMPQAILGTVQDENMKNIMMSWYYAGYYTGLHAGQQQALKEPPSTQ
ncbi:hypothetical protein AA0113_g5211 [Alternaria arborescens]|uniref:Survival Motor Neuron Gemin2-binding domain-containing protein n=1 Tax=Alternaria arborescens TaxID=156630 RepID=A0A4Q4S685_9PLEO|nr:hypothetical protein AA0111_g4438 [Alternaria arborescens]RYN23539.1 hypothetical protein AA0112_g9406 [Alternaria arborescens]RYO32548.1 hypothetical protein AA0111_g4438 [Alternaria arborescens]RYO65302.1 hypothetical protein AA0113_g5211 [Alternaria arborescens]